MFHGVLLLVSVALLPVWLNLVPLSCLGAILLVTGFKLASPALFRRMWDEGRYQFLPFIVTVVAIVLTDLLVGVLIGLAVSTGSSFGATSAGRFGASSRSTWAATSSTSSCQPGQLSEPGGPRRVLDDVPARRPRPARRRRRPTTSTRTSST